MARQIRYSEPASYFPKEIRDKYFKEEKKETPKKTAKPKAKTPAKKK